MSEADKKEIEKVKGLKLPGFLLSRVPMAILLVVLNFTSLGAPTSCSSVCWQPWYAL